MAQNDQQAPKTITVAVNLTIEVDPEAWELNYGIEGAAQIREDVKTYVTGVVDGSNDAHSAFRSVKVR